MIHVAKSSVETILRGIPLGSLGPLLFLLYIVLLWNIFCRHWYVFLLSDSLIELESVVNIKLELVLKYCAINKLLINFIELGKAEKQQEHSSWSQTFSRLSTTKCTTKPAAKMLDKLKFVHLTRLSVLFLTLNNVTSANAERFCNQYSLYPFSLPQD